MRFTKENIERIFDKFMQGGDSLADLKEQILNIADTPEKVVLPKFIAVYLDKAKSDISLMRVFEIANGYLEYDCFKNEYNWIRKNSETFARAWLNGYEVEKEPLYYIPLPHLEQVLSQRKNGMNYFAGSPNEILKQRYTKEELERVPEIYKPFAKLIEEEAND